jgi:pimeloyl-ACP methyl ester carboxylesterase
LSQISPAVQTGKTAHSDLSVLTPEFGLLTARSAGEGEPVLVVLHGIGGNAEGWSAQLHEFARHFRVVAWNAPGYCGSTAMRSDAPTLQDYARAVIALFDGLGLQQPVNLLGHSLGGLVASEVAAAYPGRVGRLVLAACSSGHRSYSAEDRARILNARMAFRNDDPEAYARSRVPNLLSLHPDPDCVERAVAVLSRLRQPGFAHATRMVSDSDIFEHATRILAPTRVICGTQDRVTPEALNRQIASAIGGAEYVAIEGAGHWSFLEHPTVFNHLVLEFLAR